MNDDRILEFMAQVGDYMRATDRRFEQLITVMHSGFERVNTQIGQLVEEVRATNQRVDVLTDEVRATNQRVDVLTDEVRATNQRVDVLTDEVRATNQRVDVLTDEVREVKQDVRDLKTEAQTTNRRLHATFEHVGFLTEKNTTEEARFIKLETDNAELQQRLSVVEEFMRRAS